MVSSSLPVQQVEEQSGGYFIPVTESLRSLRPSTRGRFFVIGFAGLSLPFAAAVSHQITSGQHSAVPLWLLAVSTAAGFGLLWFASHRLLRPLEQSAADLRGTLSALAIPVGESCNFDDLADFPVTVAVAGTSLKEMSHELQKTSQTDPLTRLLTRQSTHKAFHRSLGAASSEQKDVYLALVDCHRLADINTRFGQPAGDEALRQVGVRLKKQLRSTDWAARWGGDEFLVMVVCHSWEIESALTRIARPIPLPPGMPPLRLTVGYTPVDRSETLYDAVTRAERALRRCHIATTIPAE
ncbi:MAG: GGDEF domain-containing protein [Myxococcales bacterium]|nr:GGDEF domain-containing protein [Myxococcales bacterium]